MRDWRALATSCRAEHKNTEGARRQRCWFKITSPGLRLQICWSFKKKGRWHLLAWRGPGGDSDYGFCPDTFTKGAQTNSVLLGSLCRPDRDDRNESLPCCKPPSNHWFISAPFIFPSTVRTSMCDTSEKGRAMVHTCENVGAAECTDRAEALPPSQLCIAAQNANHRVTSAT